MQIQKLYTTMKPYAVISLLVLCIGSLSANAMGHKKGDRNSENSTELSQHKSEDSKHHHRQMKKKFHHLAKNLDLTSEQRSEMKAIFAGMKEDQQANRSALSGYKEQLKLLVAQSQFDEDQFNAIYAEFQVSFQQLAMEKAKQHHAVMQILTPEQKVKYLAMRKHR